MQQTSVRKKLITYSTNRNRFIKRQQRFANIMTTIITTMSMKLTNNEQWILDYLKVDILPRALVVGVCQTKKNKIYGTKQKKTLLELHIP